MQMANWMVPVGGVLGTDLAAGSWSFVALAVRVLVHAVAVSLLSRWRWFDAAFSLVRVPYGSLQHVPGPVSACLQNGNACVC